MLGWENRIVVERSDGMRRSGKWPAALAGVALVFIAIGLVSACNAQNRTGGSSLFSLGGSTSGMQLITPEDLVKVLKSAKGTKPLILNVGPRMLFVQAHIPGAEYIGATYEAQGVEALRSRVKALPRTKYIVIYCGCCPWEHCPNIQPAYKALADMGFKNVNALYIPNNLGADWVYKGYPTVSGQ